MMEETPYLSEISINIKYIQQSIHQIDKRLVAMETHMADINSKVYAHDSFITKTCPTHQRAIAEMHTTMKTYVKFGGGLLALVGMALVGIVIDLFKP